MFDSKEGDFLFFALDIGIKNYIFAPPLHKKAI